VVIIFLQIALLLIMTLIVHFVNDKVVNKCKYNGRLDIIIVCDFNLPVLNWTYDIDERSFFFNNISRDEEPTF
jgi:hypothetical protein